MSDIVEKKCGLNKKTKKQIYDNKRYQINREKALKYVKEKRDDIKNKIMKGDFVKPDIKMKICTKCKIEKDIDCFTYCKAYNYYNSRCKECNMVRERERRAKKKEEINARRRQIRKPKTIKQRITQSLRKRLHDVVKYRKHMNLYFNLLGCTKEFLMKWFEYIFEEDRQFNMTWDNYGTVWQIDHVTPCAYFNLENEIDQKICFHWTNLCPVLKQYNLTKQDKIVRNDQLKQIIRITDFTNSQHEITNHKHKMILITNELSVLNSELPLTIAN